MVSCQNIDHWWGALCQKGTVLVPFFTKKGTIFQNGSQGHYFGSIFFLSAGFLRGPTGGQDFFKREDQIIKVHNLSAQSRSELLIKEVEAYLSLLRRLGSLLIYIIYRVSPF